MFEFSCFRSSHEELLHQMLFDIEIGVLQNSGKSFNKTAEPLQLY